ncbi:MAG TPA: GTPase Era [Nevskiaceae bacterium]|nr:GTPase Era [Nevskiaceae bacterium]
MRSGMVTILGRPNVGKSSLLNALVGQKVSIVSHKPQTTRHRIQGVLHHADGQIVFVDTPGLHRGGKKALNRAMNEAATGAVSGVDLVLFVIEAGRFTEEDQAVLDQLKDESAPVALVINKVDRVDDKEKLLPELQQRSSLREFAFVVPLSATKKANLDALVKEILARLPEGDPLYPEDMIAGHDMSFTVSELVREKLTRTLHQELPYALTVQIEEYKQEGRLDRISAVIWVEREGQKKIVIGEQGAALKAVGSATRRELERMTGRKVFLKLWCKVRENWSDDPGALKTFGIVQE